MKQLNMNVFILGLMKNGKSQNNVIEQQGNKLKKIQQVLFIQIPLNILPSSEVRMLLSCVQEGISHKRSSVLLREGRVRSESLFCTCHFLNILILNNSYAKMLYFGVVCSESHQRQLKVARQMSDGWRPLSRAINIINSPKQIKSTKFHISPIVYNQGMGSVTVMIFHLEKSCCISYSPEANI